MLRRGRWARGRLLSVGATLNQTPSTKIGLRTRRGLKGAVVRNRLKRQLRAILREKDVVLCQGLDIVIVLHPPSPPVPTEHLKRELVILCKRLGAAS